ncbi:MAG: 50S ribosomal protein L17 [Candidatus Woykebacteria bacterium]
MRHRVSQKKLSRDTNARKALLKNLATSLVLHEKIVTTTTKAKAVRPFVEKLVTVAKEDTIINRRYLSTKLDKDAAVRKILELVGPTFKERPGGYTRIIKASPRAGDRADMSIIEFVDNVSETAAKRKLEEKKPKKISKKELTKVQTEQKKTTTKSKTSRIKSISKKAAAEGKKK